MKKLIIANWKMNPGTIAEARSLAQEMDREGLVIAPPHPFLSAVGEITERAELGAQDMFWEDNGAFTGEVSASQLAALGVMYVIIGHSERRRHVGETDEMVARKAVSALRQNLIPILCVGETKDEHDAGFAERAVQKQLEEGLAGLAAAAGARAHMVIAYEPIWAIGTGAPDTPENTLSMISFMKKTLIHSKPNIRYSFIYGGSVDSRNAEAFLNRTAIEGVLVGGASLKPKEMNGIMDIAKQY